jgi:hypothetical protein
MFETFLTRFRADHDSPSKEVADCGLPFESKVTALSELLTLLGGGSFNGGIYRVHTSTSAQHWTKIAEEFFPTFSGRIFAFGYDWLGRQFVLDNARVSNGEAQVLLLDPGFNETLEIPASLMSFHEAELPNYPEEALAESFYRQWLSTGGAMPSIDQCIGYRVPPTLGGKDTVENLELCDIEVYWGILGQLPKKHVR